MRKVKHLLLAVDIALRKSGYILLSDEGSILEKGVVIVSPKLDYRASVVDIYEKFFIIFTEIAAKYGKEITLVVEDVADFFHKKSALAIHAARTSMLLSWDSAHISNAEIHYYTPSSVKYFLTNKRGADKIALQEGIVAKYPQYDLSSMNEDEIDALALALKHIGEKNGTIPDVKQRKPARRTRA